MNLDRSVSVERFPRPGETIIGSDVRVDNGGKGANQAVAAARLGAAVRMIGAVGDDADGTRLRAGLESEGIDAEALLVAALPTGAAFITVDGGGENSIVVAPGANHALTSDDVAHAWGRAPDVTLAQLEVPAAAVLAAMQRPARLRVLNPAPGRPLDEALLASVDVIVPNRVELATIVGGAALADLNAVAGAARELGVTSVVVTLGGEGALVVEGKTVVQVPAIDVPVVDTTAAGDSFCGALAVALGSGKDIEAAVEFAVACAAFTVQRRGAQASLPRLADIT